MKTINRLAGAALGMHFSDQIALVATPLVAAIAFGAQPATIGLLVACQSAAHLVGSLPFGVLVDRRPLGQLAKSAAILAGLGFCCAMASLGLGSVVAFGAAMTLAGFGSVLFGLTALSILPRVADAEGLGSANAAIEIPRAACSFLVPLVLGVTISTVPEWSLFFAGFLGAVLAWRFAQSLPRLTQTAAPRQPLGPQIVEGARFVLRHTLLLPIALCAVFWNFAFAALLVVLVPVIQNLYRYDPGSFGIALSAFGLAAICGSWLSGRIGNRVPPSVILLFGPTSSALAAGGLLVIGPQTAPHWLYVLFFLLGFGPSMWLVAQNAVRQLVTPPQMLGRVNAVVQTAIYGVRPLGALIGGVWAAQFGLGSGLHLVVAGFAISCLVAVASDLRSVGSYQALRP